MKKILVAAFAIVAVNLYSQSNALLPMDPKIKTGTLPNGMKYYIQKNSKPEKRAELRLAVNAGSTMENDDQQGLAHFVEHMAFNGSQNFKKNELVNYLEGIGTKFGPDLNAYTSFDETVYMLQIPTDDPEKYKKGFLILDDWAHGLSFDSTEIEKERGVVMEEWRLGQGAFERMSRKFWPMLFKDSKYADRIPIGKPEILKGCKQSTLKQFYYDWYRPDLQAIIVVGDIDVEATEKLIKEQFSKIPANKNARPLLAWEIPDQKGLRMSIVSDKESPYNVMQFMYMLPPDTLKTMNHYREQIKQQLFNGMITARLTELTKKADAPFMYSGAGFQGFVRNKTSYGCFALFPNGKAEKAFEAVVTENERVKRFGFTPTEFERMKKQMLTEIENHFNEREKTESKSIINEIVQNFLVGTAVPGIENEFKFMKDLLPGIKLEEINDMAEQCIRPNGDNAMLVMMMAEKEGAKLPTEEDLRTVFAKAEANKEIKAYEDKVINEPLVAKRPRGQKAIKTTDKGQGVTELTLGNGVRILLKPTDFKEDEILFAAHSWGGTNLYEDKDFHSANASNAVQDEMGYGKFDKIAMDKYLQDKTAGVNLGVGSINETMNGSSSKKDFEIMLQLIYSAFTAPRKDSSAFAAYLQLQKGFIQNRLADPGSAFQDFISAALTNNHFRSMPLTEKTLKQINIHRAHDIFRERFSDPSDFVFVFTGSFKTDSIKPLLESYIGGISASTRKETVKDLNVKKAKGNLKKELKKGNNPRSSVQLFWDGPFVYNRKNRFELTALAKLMNIKLRENLREDKGGVYGVGLYPSVNNYPKPMYAYIEAFSCAPENVEKLIAASIDEINDVKKNGCNEINLGKIKETLLKERETQLKENNFWSSYILNSDIYNEPLDDINVYNSWVNALKSEDFKRLANLYFNDKEFKRFVLNPEK
ncbi:MAG: insulinase family protein [Bacteroidetes bacterium]|nr:insulinase family protein [Bacteroidota bacterium]